MGVFWLFVEAHEWAKGAIHYLGVEIGGLVMVEAPRHPRHQLNSV